MTQCMDKFCYLGNVVTNKETKTCKSTLSFHEMTQKSQGFLIMNRLYESHYQSLLLWVSESEYL